jgi:hypothetical protein
MGAGKEVAEIYEFAVGFVLDYRESVISLAIIEFVTRTVDDAPLVLAAANVPSVHHNGSL